MFTGDLIQFNLLAFIIVWGRNWLHAYGSIIDYKDLKVILCNEKGQEVHLHGQWKEKPCS